ncbi:transcriptional regulator [Streptomyces youssoufiensis]
MTARPRAGHKANERLRAVMEEAACSATGLARRVNSCGAEHGLDLHYDKTSVARWLRGQQPRGRAPAIIAEALERKLGRVVTVDEIGMNPGPGLDSAVGLRFEPTVPGAIQQACALWRSDASHTGSPARGKLAMSVLVESSRDWLIAVPDPAVVGDGTPPTHAPDVATVRAATAALADLDHRFGSGHVRPLAVHYLNTVVSDLLAGSYDEATGRCLLGAAARLTELAGYMAVDTGQLGLAQRYAIQALRLAQAADDRGFGGYVLAFGMSRLALRLGNPREAIQLARVAREGTRGHTSTMAQAVFHATEARGHALLGDAPACERAVGLAVETWKLDGADQASGWCGRVDRAFLEEELARCYRDINQPAIAVRWAQEALLKCPPRRVRRRALRHLLVASLQLELGDVDHSVGTATDALELIHGLRSSQVHGALEALRGRLEALGRQEEARVLRVHEPAR